MPIVRYQVRNEYGLADPVLYGAAERNDPEALLEGVAMAGLVGVLRQLGDLAEFAAEIFHDLHEEVMVTSARGHTLMLRVQQLEVEFPAIEKAILSQSSHSNLAPSSGIDWHPNIQMDKNLVTQGDMPRFILNSYEECRGPPQLVTLDKFDIAGAGACLKRYSDPSIFKINFASSGKMEPEIQREKRARKLKKKGLRLKNGETLESLMKPDEDSKSLISEKASKSLSLKRVKLKTRPVNSANTVSGRSYIESILYEQPTTNSLLYEDSFDQSYLKTKLVEPSPKMHEIAVDTVFSNSLARKRGQVQSASQQRAEEEDNGDGLKKKKDEHATKEPLLKPENREEKISSVVGSNNDDELCGDSGTQGNDNHTGELGLKDSAEPSVKADGTDVYVSDGVASELDTYVDALTTMDSEIDTDNEGRTKPLPGLLNMKSQGMDSDTDEEHERKVHLDSHSTECSSGMLNYCSLYNEKSGLVTGDCAGASSDIQAYENNVVPSYATEKSGGFSSAALSGDLGKTASKDQDVAAVDNRIYNDKELDGLSAKSEFGLATYGSCIAGAASLAHGGPQAGSEETQSSLPYLNLSTEADICTSNVDPNPQQFTEEQSSNACLQTMHSEDVGDTIDVSKISDVETMPSSGIRDVLSDTSHMKSCDMEGSNTSITCDFVNEGETSMDCSMINELDDVQIKVHFVPYASVPEEVNLENISTKNFQKLPPSSAENCQNGLVTQYPKDNDGKIKITTLVGESACSRIEMLLKETDDVAGSEPQISSIQKPEMEQFSDAESEMFRDAKLQGLSSDNLQTDLPDGSSQMLDDAELDGSVLVGAHSNLPTISVAPETCIDAFPTDRNTGEFALHDSGSGQGNLNRNVICSLQNDHGLDSQKSFASSKENNIMVLAEPHDTCSSLDNSSLKLNNTFSECLFGSVEESLSCTSIKVANTYSSDAVQASDVKHTSSSRSQDDFSSVSSTDDNNRESSSNTLIEGGIRTLSAQQQHDADDQQLEKTKASHSSNHSSTSIAAIPTQKEVKTSCIETVVTPENHILLLSDDHYSESPGCFHHVDNNQCEPDKYMNLGKDNETSPCSVENNHDHGLDSQKAVPSEKENSIMVLAEAHDNSSLNLSNAPSEYLLENGEVSLRCCANPSDAVQDSDVKHSSSSRLQDDISGVSSTDEDNQETSLRELIEGGIRVLSAQQQHDDQQLEEAKVGHSLDPLPMSRIAVSAQKEVKTSGIETDVIPEHHILLLSDHQSSESPGCFNYVDNDKSEPENYVTLDKEDEARLCSIESGQDHGLDSQKSIPSNKENNMMIFAESHSICTSVVNSSLKLNNTPRENFIENEGSLSGANMNVVSAYPSDAIEASDVKHSLFSRLQDDISNMSVADENTLVTSSHALFHGKRGLSTQQQHDLDDQQLEEANVCHSSDPSPTLGDTIPTKKDVKASAIKTDVIPEYHILLFPDHHSFESPGRTNYVDNDQSKPNKYANIGKDKEVELHSVESNQGSDSVSSLHESLEDSTNPVSVPSMTTTSIVQSPDPYCSASVEVSHSLVYSDASNNRPDSVNKPLIAETQFNSPVTIDTSVNSGHDLSNGYNFQHIDIEAQFLSQSIANLSARSMGNSSDVDIELQKASSGLLATETSVLHISSTIEHDMKFDNAPEQVEAGAHAMHVCSHDDPLVKSTESMDDSFVLPHIDSTSNHTVTVADVPTQSDFETILETDNKIDTPVPDSLSFNFSVPEFSSKLSQPVGYDQVFSIPIPGHNVLERPADEAPPLPPLPPLQWRLGKPRAISGMPTGATVVPSYLTPEPFSGHSPEYPNPLAEAEEAYHKNPSKYDKPKSDDVNDCLDGEETRVNSNLLEGKNECGTASVGGEIASPSHLFGPNAEDQEYYSGQNGPKEATRQQENLFVPVAVSCNESNQHVSSSLTEPAKPLNSFVLIPVLGHSGPHGTEPTLARNLAPPLNQYLFGSTVENGNQFYGRGDLGDERIQALDVSAMQGVMHNDNSFLHGGKDAYVPYSLFSVVDSGKPNGRPRSILNRPRHPLIEAVATHDKSTLRKVSEMAQTSSKPKVDERDTLLEQIRNKSFNLKPAVTKKPKVHAPSANLKVSAILEKANAIRQAFVGSDEDDDDSWSDC